MQNVVLYLFFYDYHNYFFLGLNGYVKQLLRFKICRASRVNYRAAARAELPRRGHYRVRKAAVYYTVYYFVFKFRHFIFLPL